MLGFTARSTTNDITLGGPELEDARWMSRLDIVAALEERTLRLPSTASISFRLITEWFDAGPLGRLAEIAAGTLDVQRRSGR
jgi:NAD+ diphosphatase